MALKLFLAVWVTVVTMAAVTNASPPKPRCHISVNSYPHYTTDAAGHRHFTCARLNLPK